MKPAPKPSRLQPAAEHARPAPAARKEARGPAFARAVHRFARAQRGVTAVEFALVSVPFVFVMGLILEIGVMSYAEAQLQFAAEEAGRTIRIGSATSGSDFRNEICDEVVVINSCNSQIGLAVVSASSFGTLVVPAVSAVSYQPVPSFSPGIAEQAVAIVVTHDWEFIIPFLRPLSNLPSGNARRLHGLAVFMNEP